MLSFHAFRPAVFPPPHLGREKGLPATGTEPAGIGDTLAQPFQDAVFVKTNAAPTMAKFRDDHRFVGFKRCEADGTFLMIVIWIVV